MFLFKYERFIHDFLGFYGCLLDPETKSKWSFSKILDIHLPRLATSLPRLATSLPRLVSLLQP